MARYNLYPKYDSDTYYSKEIFTEVCKNSDLRPVWAKVNSIKWGAEYAPFLELCQRHCPLCNSELDYGIGKNNHNKLDSNTPSTDHKIPRSTGGTNDINNLWIICERCNRMKNNATFEDVTRFRNLAKFLEESQR